MKRSISIMLMLFLFSATTIISAQSESKKDKIMLDTKEAKAEFLESDWQMKKYFENAYGYVIFPNVGKAGLGIGGAAGNGVAYEKGTEIGMAKLSQLTIGLQAGGQAYREIIFFETKEEMDRFKKNKIEFSAQASAIAVKAGASADAKYSDGVLVFTLQKGGLMYEASIGGQKLKFNAF
jgi:lipid-binding SYLF domain-containing protein